MNELYFYPQELKISAYSVGLYHVQIEARYLKLKLYTDLLYVYFMLVAGVRQSGENCRIGSNMLE